jgi:hypothetical protein
MGASECKPSPRSILGDEPSTLKFRALLNEGAAECFELTRVAASARSPFADSTRALSLRQPGYETSSEMSPGRGLRAHAVVVNPALFGDEADGGPYEGADTSPRAPGALYSEAPLLICLSFVKLASGPSLLDWLS